MSTAPIGGGRVAALEVLIAIMAKTVVEFSRYRPFAGFSMHDVRAWRQLLSRQPSPLPTTER